MVADASMSGQNPRGNSRPGRKASTFRRATDQNNFILRRKPCFTLIDEFIKETDLRIGRRRTRCKAMVADASNETGQNPRGDSKTRTQGIPRSDLRGTQN
ncbi:hypothetical protein JTB14_023007 [Gonioctena quinquepunctata]|nr:hypothetical protein JTB14_023007 [Gonioctena quinquepunctata]